MSNLHEDVLRQILSFLPLSTLLSCRLTDRAFGRLATAVAFKHVRLDTFNDTLPFIRISRSAELRSVVREVTIDAGESWWALPDGSDNSLYLSRYAQFLIALPRLRCFSHTRVLYIRFKTDSRIFYYPSPPDDPSQPQPRDQARLLSAILKCLTGTWTEQEQRDWESHWQIDHLRRQWKVFDLFESYPAAKFSQPAISLSALTIQNLHEILQDDFYTSTAFQSLFCAHPPSILKLFIDPDRRFARRGNSDEERDFDDYVFQPKFYNFCELVPSTWLCPPLAANLQVLSLCCRNYFGWVPKLDLRMVNPGHASSSGLPNLRVLTLKGYVFSHQWQVDWVASLGQDNGRGGLQELNLDGCPIMWRAMTLSPMDK